MSKLFSVESNGRRITIPVENVDYIIVDYRASQIVLKSGKRIECETGEAQELEKLL